MNFFYQSVSEMPLGSPWQDMSLKEVIDWICSAPGSLCLEDTGKNNKNYYCYYRIRLSFS